MQVAQHIMLKILFILAVTVADSKLKSSPSVWTQSPVLAYLSMHYVSDIWDVVFSWVPTEYHNSIV